MCLSYANFKDKNWNWGNFDAYFCWKQEYDSSLSNHIGLKYVGRCKQNFEKCRCAVNKIQIILGLSAKDF